LRAIAFEILRHRKAEQLADEIIGDVVAALRQKGARRADQCDAGIIAVMPVIVPIIVGNIASGYILDVHGPPPRFEAILSAPAPPPNLSMQAFDIVVWPAGRTA
jgi:hypothetical protein